MQKTHPPWGWGLRAVVIWGAVWAAASAGGAWALSLVPVESGLGIDFTAFWSASRALVAGEPPYDGPTLKRYTDDLGVAEPLRVFTAGHGHMPFYYPLWFLFGIVPLLPLGFTVARCLWTTWMFQAYFASIVLIARRTRGSNWVLLVSATSLLIFWGAPLRVGQPLPMLLLAALIVVVLWDRGHDAAAGAVAGMLLVKPQLGLLPAAVLVVAACRRGRYAAAWSFLGVQAGLAAAALLFRLAWPIEFLEAPRRNAGFFFTTPGISATFWEVLRTGVGFDGLVGAAAGICYLASALFVVGGLGLAAWDRRTSLERLLAAALLGDWFVMQYLRHYDLPILAFTALHLSNRRPASKIAAFFLLTWWLGGLFDETLFQSLAPRSPLTNNYVKFFWMPLWTALWWTWDAFAPLPESVKPIASDPASASHTASTDASA